MSSCLCTRTCLEACTRVRAIHISPTTVSQLVICPLLETVGLGCPCDKPVLTCLCCDYTAVVVVAVVVEVRVVVAVSSHHTASC